MATKTKTKPTEPAHTGRPLRIAYRRVSSADQNTDRQLDGLTFDVEYTDKASGKDTLRPQLQALMTGKWAPGSTVVVHSMDRLARSLDDLRRIVTELTERVRVFLETP